MAKGILIKNLTSARIDFIVTQTGTRMKLERRKSLEDYRLFQDGFKPGGVNKLDRTANAYRTRQRRLLFTQHHSDHISAHDIDSLSALGIGKANFGPEMTMPELTMLLSWEKQECVQLEKPGTIEKASGFRKAMIHELDKNPEFWQEYIPSDQRKSPKKSLSEYNSQVQDSLMIFRGRYVKNRPMCAAAIKNLTKNIVELGIHPNPTEAIIEYIKTTSVIPRIGQLRMGGILDAFPDGVFRK
jgi:hypothetical protein